MAIPELKVEYRDGAGKGVARKLRAKGLIPGVIYGGDQGPANLSVDPLALKKIILSSPARTFLLDLNVAGQPERTILKEFKVHPVKRQLLHVDFQRVKANETVTLEVAVEFTGTPKGVGKGGLFEVKSHFLKVSGLPDKLPQAITLEVGELEMGQALKVSDLSLAEGLKVEADPHTVLCLVATPSLMDEKPKPAEGETEEAAKKA